MAIVVEHEKRRRQILHKALDVFIDEGFEDASFQKIAERCKITRTTLYMYFRNRQEIFNFSVKQFMAEVEWDILAIKDDTALSWAAKLRKTLVLILRRLEENRRLLSVILNYLLIKDRQENPPDAPQHTPDAPQHTPDGKKGTSAQPERTGEGPTASGERGRRAAHAAERPGNAAGCAATPARRSAQARERTRENGDSAKRGFAPDIRVRRRTIRLRHILSAMLIAGIKAGELKPVNVGATNDLFFCLIESAIFHLTVLRRESTQDLMDAAELAVKSISAEG